MLTRFDFFGDGLPLVLLLAMTVAATTLNAASPFPDATQLPARTDWPEPLTTFRGETIASKRLGLKARRPEWKDLFQHYMYGTAPPPPQITATIEREDKRFFDGKATMKEVTIALGPSSAPRIHLLMVAPNNRRKPVPAFLGLN